MLTWLRTFTYTQGAVIFGLYFSIIVFVFTNIHTNAPVCGLTDIVHRTVPCAVRLRRVWAWAGELYLACHQANTNCSTSELSAVLLGYTVCNINSVWTLWFIGIFIGLKKFPMDGLYDNFYYFQISSLLQCFLSNCNAFSVHQFTPCIWRWSREVCCFFFLLYCFLQEILNYNPLCSKNANKYSHGETKFNEFFVTRKRISNQRAPHQYIFNIKPQSHFNILPSGELTALFFFRHKQTKTETFHWSSLLFCVCVCLCLRCLCCVAQCHTAAAIVVKLSACSFFFYFCFFFYFN